MPIVKWIAAVRLAHTTLRERGFDARLVAGGLDAGLLTTTV